MQAGLPSVFWTAHRATEGRAFGRIIHDHTLEVESHLTGLRPLCNIQPKTKYPIFTLLYRGGSRSISKLPWENRPLACSPRYFPNCVLSGSGTSPAVVPELWDIVDQISKQIRSSKHLLLKKVLREELQQNQAK